MILTAAESGNVWMMKVGIPKGKPPITLLMSDVPCVFAVPQQHGLKRGRTPPSSVPFQRLKSMPWARNASLVKQHF